MGPDEGRRREAGGMVGGEAGRQVREAVHRPVTPAPASPAYLLARL